MRKLISFILIIFFALRVGGQPSPKYILNNLNQIITNEISTNFKNSAYYDIRDYYSFVLNKRLPLDMLKTQKNDILYVQIKAHYVTGQSIGVATWTKSGLYHAVSIEDSQNHKVETYTTNEAKRYVEIQKYLRGSDRDFMPVPELIYIAENEKRSTTLDSYFVFINIK